MTTTTDNKRSDDYTYPGGVPPNDVPLALRADPREKLIALIQWAASPDCPLELPSILQGLMPIWLPMWLGKIETMKPEDLDRAAGHVLELSSRVRDPNITLDEFKAWLPRA